MPGTDSNAFATVLCAMERALASTVVLIYRNMFPKLGQNDSQPEVDKTWLVLANFPKDLVKIRITELNDLGISHSKNVPGSEQPTKGPRTRLLTPLYMPGIVPFLRGASLFSTSWCIAPSGLFNSCAGISFQLSSDGRVLLETPKS